MTSTFETHLDQLDLFRVASEAGATRAEIIEVIRELDAAVAAVEGHGFEPTPFGPEPTLAEAAGLPSGAELWVKNETGNVSGSHKARHLFGVAVASRLTGGSDAPFAIASCGNAALGASVVAAAVEHPIEVFVPRWANEAVVDRIETLGGKVVRCDREDGVLGDPAHHAMVAAIADGAIAFSCQGTETPLAVDGGRTLALEMADQLTESGVSLDRILIQVGGGALGSAVVTGLQRALGDEPMPVVHAVQPLGNHPLVRAWDRLVADLGGTTEEPETNADRAAAAFALGVMSGGGLDAALERCRTNPDRYMGPWPDEPASYATGILDDITYDWIDLIAAMLATGGFPIVAAEDDLRTAHRLAHRHTDIAVCPTGASGLGGLITLRRDVPAVMRRDERVAVIFSGHMRPGDPDPLADVSA